jgi:hypothetical protein
MDILKNLVTAADPAGLATYVAAMALFSRNHCLRALAGRCCSGPQSGALA